MHGWRECILLLMVVILHIVVALASIGVATMVFFHPSRNHFSISYSLIVATLLSGIYLVMSDPARMLHVCISGSIYTILVLVATIVAHKQFNRLQESKS